MNKVNKLVSSTFDKDVVAAWMSEDFQKKLKRAMKKKGEDVVPGGTAVVKQHTPYIQFCIAERPNIKKENPSLSAKEITAKLGERWNQYKLENPDMLVEKYGYVKKE